MMAPSPKTFPHRLRAGLDLRASRAVRADNSPGALVAPPAGLDLTPAQFERLFEVGESDLTAATRRALEVNDELAEAGRSILLLQRTVDELRAERARREGPQPARALEVLFDVDGPVSDYVGAAEAWARRKYRRRLVSTPARRSGVATPAWQYSPDHWDLRHNLPPDIAEAVTRASMAPGFCASLVEVPGAREGVTALLALDGVDGHAVTTAWPGSATWAGEREAWLAARWPELRVTFTPEKWRVRGDLLVDDKYETLVKWKAAWPAGTAVLWAAGWNRPYWGTAVEPSHLQCRSCLRLFRADAPLDERQGTCRVAAERDGFIATPPQVHLLRGSLSSEEPVVGETGVALNARDEGILIVDGWPALLALVTRLRDERRAR